MDSENFWLKRVLDSMQDMDEMGGPETEEYIEIMKEISRVALERADNAEALLNVRECVNPYCEYQEAEYLRDSCPKCTSEVRDM